jgi:hypothetical protein
VADEVWDADAANAQRKPVDAELAQRKRVKILEPLGVACPRIGLCGLGPRCV